MRDITIGDTFDVKFTTTEPDTGAPATLAGTPVVSAYVGNSTTQITAGITLTVDFDGVTGLHNVRVVATTGNGYADGTDVSLVITTGTVDAVSAVGYVIENFTIGRSASNAAAKPLARAAYLVDTTIATLATQTSFTLTAGSADDDAYNGMAFIFTDASTATQKGMAFASDYTGSTRTVTLEAGPDFTIATSDLVTVVPAGSATTTPIPVNVTQISGDATAADNLESYCDGTTPQPVNVTQISGDATAADNLESYTDGTTPIPANMTQISGDATAADNLESYTDGTAVIPANMEQINTVPVTGDGSGTPFSV